MTNPEMPAGSRLERALRLAPLIEAEFDALGLASYEEAADNDTTLHELPPVLANALRDLPDDDRQDLNDLRLVVAATEPEYLEMLDLTLMRAAALHGDLIEATIYFASLMQNHNRTKFAVIAFEQWYYDLLDAS